MVKTIFISFFLIVCTKSKCQNSILGKVVTDTITLDSFYCSRIVAYKLELVTVFLCYDEFKTSIINLEADYKGHPPANIYGPVYRSLKNSRKKSLKILGSIIKKLNQQTKIVDTIVLVYKPLDNRTLWMWQLNKIITSQIEKNNCAIMDRKNEMHLRIIRSDGPWNWGSGGRRYFLSGSDAFFIDQMTWIK
jgi:hypothetical protein